MERIYTISIFVTISRFKYFESFLQNVKKRHFRSKIGYFQFNWVLKTEKWNVWIRKMNVIDVIYGEIGGVITWTSGVYLLAFFTQSKSTFPFTVRFIELEFRLAEFLKYPAFKVQVLFGILYRNIVHGRVQSNFRLKQISSQRDWLCKKHSSGRRGSCIARMVASMDSND